VEWFHADAVVTLHSWTVVRHSVHRAVEGRVPYIVALVALNEGPIIVCNVLDLDPADLSIGMALRLDSGPALTPFPIVQAYEVG
jgi:uncharacterized OB-fold protein